MLYLLLILFVITVFIVINWVKPEWIDIIDANFSGDNAKISTSDEPKANT